MDKSWDTFEFLGRFPIHTYTAPAPHPLTPRTMLDACSSLLVKDRVLICRDATNRSILAPGGGGWGTAIYGLYRYVPL